MTFLESSDPEINVEDIMVKLRQNISAKKERGEYSDREVERISRMELALFRKEEEFHRNIRVLLEQAREKKDPNIFESITSHRPIIGPVIIFVKGIIRRVFRVYSKMILKRQGEFNNSIFEIIHRSSFQVFDILDHQVRIEGHVEELAESSLILQSVLNQLKERETVIESRLGQCQETLEILTKNIEENQQDIQREKQRLKSFQLKAEDLLEKMEHPVIQIDSSEERRRLREYEYFDFENTHRGSRNEIKDRQKQYIQHFKGFSTIVDIGCGRGEFLELCREHGIPASGIDINEDMVRFCSEQGLKADQVDLFEYLRKLEDGVLGGIFMAQVIEHLDSEEIQRFINLSSQKIRPNGIILVETINPLVLTTAPTFWLDLDHKRPVHPESLRILLENAGFGDINIILASPFPEEHKLEEVVIPDNCSATEGLNRNFNKVNNILFGHQDYAIRGRRL